MTRFSKDDEVLQEPLPKQNMSKSRFHLVRETYCRIKFYILSRYTLVVTTLTKQCFLGRFTWHFVKEVHFIFYNTSKAEVSKSGSKVEVSKCAPVS